MRFSSKAIAATALAIAAAAPTAQAAEIGQTAPPGETSFGCVSAVQERSAAAGPSYVAPFTGEITRWRFQAGATPTPVALQVFRPVSTTFPLSWLVVSQSRLERPRPNRLNTFRASVPAAAGDVLALRGGPGNARVESCYFLSRLLDDNVLDFARAFSPGETAVQDGPGTSGVRLNVSATIEDVCRNKHGRQKKPSWCSKRP